MTMVRIDGARVKLLREQQGLTQLYLATAVDVTTDTISRWENKRYPSIKGENARKLAEALGVAVDEILEQQGERISASSAQPPPDAVPATRASFTRSWPLLLLAATLMACIALVYFSLLPEQSSALPKAQRQAPTHMAPGQLVPVVIIVSSPDEEPKATILREQLPDGLSLISIAPEAAGTPGENGEIRWLNRVGKSKAFTYLVKVEAPPETSLEFSGELALTGDVKIPIEGPSQAIVNAFHWADGNRDGIISDQEVLQVHDRYSEVPGLAEEIDLVEEIWLGNGYSYDKDSQRFTIKD
jgi:transcriptional regulator with XRE-family HTH domain